VVNPTVAEAMMILESENSMTALMGRRPRVLVTLEALGLARSSRPLRPAS
jgi:hypothetical protein